MDVQLFVAPLPLTTSVVLRMKLTDPAPCVSTLMTWTPRQVVAVPAQPPHSEHPSGKTADGDLHGGVIYNSLSEAFQSITCAIDGRSTVQGKTALKEVRENIEAPVILPCNHIVGATCISKWLENADTCPMCRAQLDVHSSRVLQRQSDTSSYFLVILQRLFLLISGLLTSAAE